ncbi:hypothetical protein [Auraticoccus monumenti]|uniref:Uncharacterized protein n=1 Tax=Auraticoccus monumenti TaxID=675864 RepID=A0A1G6UP25_9ACTN|nr:hypothetical protein [Auraticoccus monumenti]SDD42305.1 hypothetical protein SAMN04489747_0917 [Auraticoccus monumenti]
MTAPTVDVARLRYLLNFDTPAQWRDRELAVAAVNALGPLLDQLAAAEQERDDARAIIVEAALETYLPEGAEIVVSTLLRVRGEARRDREALAAFRTEAYRVAKRLMRRARAAERHEARALRQQEEAREALARVEAVAARWVHEEWARHAVEDVRTALRPQQEQGAGS